MNKQLTTAKRMRIAQKRPAASKMFSSSPEGSARSRGAVLGDADVVVRHGAFPKHMALLLPPSICFLMKILTVINFYI